MSNIGFPSSLEWRDLGLPVDENHRVMEWNNGELPVYFSFSQRGGAAMAHIASPKRSLLLIRQAINDFFKYLIGMPWCKMSGGR